MLLLLSSPAKGSNTKKKFFTRTSKTTISCKQLLLHMPCLLHRLWQVAVSNRQAWKKNVDPAHLIYYNPCDISHFCSFREPFLVWDSACLMNWWKFHPLLCYPLYRGTFFLLLPWMPRLYPLPTTDQLLFKAHCLLAGYWRVGNLAKTQLSQHCLFLFFSYWI